MKCVKPLAEHLEHSRHSGNFIFHLASAPVNMAMCRNTIPSVGGGGGGEVRERRREVVREMFPQ